MCDNMNLTDENRIREIVKEELTNFSPQKKKRAPNKWQLFLKECTKEQTGDLSYTDKVKVCSAKYKENKKDGASNTNNERKNDVNNGTNNGTSSDTNMQYQENQ